VKAGSWPHRKAHPSERGRHHQVRIVERERPLDRDVEPVVATLELPPVESAARRLTVADARIGPMLGFKRFRTAAITIAGIELSRRVHNRPIQPYETTR
jgi:hypothetical protein